MSRKKRFILGLSKLEIAGLQASKKTGDTAIFRSRCHAILLSNKGFDTREISEILDVKILTVYNGVVATV